MFCVSVAQKRMQQPQEECGWNCRVHDFVGWGYTVGMCPYNDVRRASYEMDAKLLPKERPDLLGGPQYRHLLGWIGWSLGSRTYGHLRFMTLRQRLKRVVKFVDVIAGLAPVVDLRLLDPYRRSGLLRIAELPIVVPDDDEQEVRKVSDHILDTLVRCYGYTQAEVDLAKAQASSSSPFVGQDVAVCFFPHRPIQFERLRAMIARGHVSDDALDWLLRAYAAHNNMWSLDDLWEGVRMLINDGGICTWDPKLLQTDGEPEVRALFRRMKEVNVERRLAVAMALHPLLGAQSGLSCLGGDLLRMCAWRALLVTF